MQSDWHKLISLLSERKSSIESQAEEWRLISQQTSIIAKTLVNLESRLTECSSSGSGSNNLSPSQKIREKVDRMRQLSEKCRCVQLDIDTIQQNVVGPCSTGIDAMQTQSLFTFFTWLCHRYTSRATACWTTEGFKKIRSDSCRKGLVERR